MRTVYPYCPKLKTKYLSVIQIVSSYISIKIIVVFLVLSLVEENISLAEFMIHDQTSRENDFGIQTMDQKKLQIYFASTDTTKKDKTEEHQNLNDELQQAIEEKDKMKDEDFLSHESEFDHFIENLEAAFEDIELPDSTDWNRAHQNLKDAMDHLKSESKNFKKDLNKAKVEMNKAIQRMQKQFQEFNEDELKEMKKELQKAMEEIKMPDEPEKPVLHKLDTIKL
jgi:hypothetical protein